jgi:hypothetical protein
MRHRAGNLFPNASEEKRKGICTLLTIFCKYEIISQLTLVPKGKPSAVVHTCNSSTWKTEAGVLSVQGQPTIYDETPSQKIHTHTFV